MTEHTDAFDLPDHLDADHVAIYLNDNDGAPFYAVPFYAEETFEDGTALFHECGDHTVTDGYRKAVADGTNIPIELIELDREIPTYGFDAEPL